MTVGTTGQTAPMATDIAINQRAPCGRFTRYIGSSIPDAAGRRRRWPSRR